jgi:osmoprotectant transport system permease protein
MSFLGAAPLAVLADPATPSNPWFSWSYVKQNSDTILTLLRYHAVLTVEAVAVAILVAVPLAILGYWFRPIAGPLFVVTGTLYTIPSLALIAFLAPYTGVTGTTTILICLVLYALMLITNNTLTGLRRVPADVLDAATGMGYGRFGRLFRIELPLALPGIMTGIRLATVSTVALVTVGVIVGQGGLGQLIIDGITGSVYKAEVVTGTLLCVLLGLAFDLVLLGLTRLMTPWSRRAVAR